ncbi:hypothetical protein SAMN05660895_2027 [Thermoflavifilum thermophilum]|uniref:Uncharacterized protein n=1 Tax=Thermoflavifilum thermophilum TaxID=1393122 RepID=A0A1I7NIQ5_9BACT|nr:hypothetical protein SAMN05660895_2027 [Thermoflavifilum thermophilum]
MMQKRTFLKYPMQISPKITKFTETAQPVPVCFYNQPFILCLMGDVVKFNFDKEVQEK